MASIENKYGRCECERMNIRTSQDMLIMSLNKKTSDELDRECVSDQLLELLC